ncbi:DASH complex, subunit Spc34 [Eremomyces bilateralis CBS 781.70]|uniref:DASH complex subunit SPC34 n=1 Tax=Eremomyces bilateralis CBS 781.70 TaxID=1392243 RepID=A0A6G1GDM7_9PEZI|nr:DASH complex, subunit Spc34 [Eremomyces bilateralis CBS 781.70]KAF1816215.1 DASH complex, subunit Spc34 [Eremomyces bilateralis CBS 781.70]
MTLLDGHLEQLSLCAVSIAELPFPPPKIFANALLKPHDITALIRDTETHEQALFTVSQPPPQPKAFDPSATSRRRTTVYSTAALNHAADVSRPPRRNTAVAAVLGGDLVQRIRDGGGGRVGSGVGYRNYDHKGEVDVDYVSHVRESKEETDHASPIPGALEKIGQLRQRHHRLAHSIAELEEQVTEQSEQLRKLNRSRGPSGLSDEEDDEDEDFTTQPEATVTVDTFPIRHEDMRQDEEDITELERKKRALEERVSALGKDITGVLG